MKTKVNIYLPTSPVGDAASEAGSDIHDHTKTQTYKKRVHETIYRASKTCSPHMGNLYTVHETTIYLLFRGGYPWSKIHQRIPGTNSWTTKYLCIPCHTTFALEKKVTLLNDKNEDKTANDNGDKNVS